MEHLAWPLAALVFATIALFVFKSNVGRLIDRIREIKRLGITTAGTEQNQAVAEVKSSSFQELMDLASSQLLRDREIGIREALKARGITNDQEATKLLTRALAASQLTLQWEQIEKTIFGSQVAILVEMNTRTLPAEVIRKVYDEAAKQYPATYDGYTFDQYVGYLENVGLIAKGGDGYQITLTGKEFLVWLVQAGKTYRRSN